MVGADFFAGAARHPEAALVTEGMTRSIRLILGLAIGMFASTAWANYSTCEHVCLDQGNNARYGCIVSGGSRATCDKEALMAYRSCVYRNCMSLFQRWTTDEEEIPDPWATP